MSDGANVDARGWIEREDTVCAHAREERLAWLIAQAPTLRATMFHGGFVSKEVFEEARYCFIYAQFMACILLGFAFIDRTVAARLYALGRDDLERVGAQRLLAEANRLGMFDDTELDALSAIRARRNPLVHFRAPLSGGTLERRACETGQDAFDLLERDAKEVVRAMFRLMAG